MCSAPSDLNNMGLTVFDQTVGEEEVNTFQDLTFEEVLEDLSAYVAIEHLRCTNLFSVASLSICHQRSKSSFVYTGKSSRRE